ncbi:hypothetical protein E2C01_019521 [Portunus trituberculatus]|uniref:Uncharacterized protein n=1 Tax=Portunus trituberculatus TaxID=210409 RepID=A0A5B7DZK8_PORTR|nr:hypothetical protein [Portunus trituberculatus]
MESGGCKEWERHRERGRGSGGGVAAPDISFTQPQDYCAFHGHHQAYALRCGGLLNLSSSSAVRCGAQS